MKVNNFRFGWEHNLVTRIVKGKEVQLKQTICKMYTIDPDEHRASGVKKLPLHQAGVVCSTEDVYSPEVGRRKSLTEVLKLVQWATDLKDEALLFSARDFRRGVWEVYRLSTKEPRWHKKVRRPKKKDETTG